MTDDTMALVELIEQGADCDSVREMLAFAAERMMDLEVTECNSTLVFPAAYPDPSD